MEQGWVKLSRKLIEWEWYDDNNVVKLFIHCLLKANHKDKKWRGIDIPKGSFLTSRDKLSLETNLSVQQVRSCLNKLKSTSEITIKTTNLNTLISIVKWNNYQSDNQQLNQQITNDQPTDNQRITTTKNDKKEKNEKNVKNIPPYEEFENHALSKKSNLCKESIKLKYDSWVENDWKDGNNKKISNWKSKLTNTVQYLKENEKDKSNNETQGFKYVKKWD